MFLTRSIRRKLVVGLCLVLLMLTMLGVAGLSGLLSYRSFVHDLKAMESEPSPTELAIACAGLFDPLLLKSQPNPHDSPFLRPPSEQQTDWRQELDLDLALWPQRVQQARTCLSP